MPEVTSKRKKTMTTTNWSDVEMSIDARMGDSMTCPGCREKVSLHWADGWRNDNGYTCEPTNTTHSQHIITLNPNLR